MYSIYVKQNIRHSSKFDQPGNLNHFYVKTMARLPSHSLVVNQGQVWHGMNFFFLGQLWHNVEIIVTEVWLTQIAEAPSRSWVVVNRNCMQS